MRLVVQKYGGSSLSNADFIKGVAYRIGKSWDSGKRIVVVVSAMGDTTDKLLSLASTISDNPERRELDLLLSSGELVSCTLTAMALRELGYHSISLSGSQAGIHTDATYGHARIDRIETTRILQELDDGKIVIVAGFQGITNDMDITTLGRGGSDTTAVALAVALEAERCEVYTDVDGIFTADPKLVSNARKLDEITYEEMLELAAFGAKMHPRSIELGSVYNMPIYVASSFSDSPGTLIHGEVTMLEQTVKVTGITYDHNVAKITLRGIPDKPGVAAELFDPLSDVGISVDTIVQNTSIDKITDLSFTVTRDELENAAKVVGPIAKSLGAEDFTTDESLAKVSIVGAGMLNSPGYASLMFKTLAKSNVNIDMITTSEIRITCIVNESGVQAAVKSLHDAFFLEQP